MSTWDASTEYGISFRGMNAAHQEAEVKRLNKVLLKGQKEVIKKKLLQVNSLMLEDYNMK
jgi:hypothetical protein